MMCGFGTASSAAAAMAVVAGALVLSAGSVWVAAGGVVADATCTGRVIVVVGVPTEPQLEMTTRVRDCNQTAERTAASRAELGVVAWLYSPVQPALGREERRRCCLSQDAVRVNISVPAVKEGANATIATAAPLEEPGSMMPDCRTR